MQVREGEKSRRKEDKVWGDEESVHCCSTESTQVLRNGLIRILHFQFVETENSCFSCCSPRCYCIYMPTKGTHTYKYIHRKKE